MHLISLLSPAGFHLDDKLLNMTKKGDIIEKQFGLEEYNKPVENSEPAPDNDDRRNGDDSKPSKK